MRSVRPSALAERTRSDQTATMSSSSMVSCFVVFRLIVPGGGALATRSGPASGNQGGSGEALGAWDLWMRRRGTRGQGGGLVVGGGSAMWAGGAEPGGGRAI